MKTLANNINLIYIAHISLKLYLNDQQTKLDQPQLVNKLKQLIKEVLDE